MTSKVVDLRQKPHIWKARLSHFSYMCFSTFPRALSSGRTPREAYENWLVEVLCEIDGGWERTNQRCCENCQYARQGVDHLLCQYEPPASKDPPAVSRNYVCGRFIRFSSPLDGA
jgi:hypothetical protein